MPEGVVEHDSVPVEWRVPGVLDEPSRVPVEWRVPDALDELSRVAGLVVLVVWVTPDGGVVAKLGELWRPVVVTWVVALKTPGLLRLVVVALKTPGLSRLVVVTVVAVDGKGGLVLKFETPVLVQQEEEGGVGVEMPDLRQ